MYFTDPYEHTKSEMFVWDAELFITISHKGE